MNDTTPQPNGDAYLLDLTATLNNLGVRLSEVGRHEEALSPSQEAVTAYQQLAEANPDAYFPNFVASLNNLKDQLTAVGRNGDVVEVEEELASVLERMGDEETDSPS
jgi:hypothetical protein